MVVQREGKKGRRKGCMWSMHVLFVEQRVSSDNYCHIYSIIFHQSSQSFCLFTNTFWWILTKKPNKFEMPLPVNTWMYCSSSIKKSPVEYYYYLSVFKPTRIRTVSADSTVKLEVMEKLKAEVDDYRTQTKSFLKEMEAKNKLIQTLEDRLSRKPDPKVQYMYT